MAVTRLTSYTSAANAIGGSLPTRLKKVHIYLAPTSTAETFVQLFNNAAPTLGTTTPNDVFEIPQPDNVAAGDKWKHTIVLPGGGKRYATALSVGVTTTYNGATGASGANAPLAVELFWDIGA